MNISVAGNIVTVKSAINAEKLKEVGLMTVKNDKKEVVYGVKFDQENANFNEYGVTFEYADAEGNAAMNILCTDLDPNASVEEKKAYIADEFGKAIDAFEKFEGEIKSAIDTVAEYRAELMNRVNVQ